MLRGGYKIVSDNNKWNEVVKVVGLTSNDINQLKDVYLKSLKHIEEAYLFLLFYFYFVL